MPKLVAINIATTLRQRIISGEWDDTGRIPPERHLASELGVARNTIRRALGVLEDQGTVCRLTGRGVFISTPPSDSLASIINRIKGTSPADMMQVRSLLEPAAAASAANAATADQIETIVLTHRQACEAPDMETFEELDAQFHQRIFDCTRNELLKELHGLLRLVRNQEQWFEMKRRSYSQERKEQYCLQHEAIVGALLSRDPDAAKNAMHDHLLSVQRNLLGN